MNALSQLSSLSSILATTSQKVGISRAGEVMGKACQDAISQATMANMATFQKCTSAMGISINGSSSPPTIASLDVTCSTECQTAFTSIANAYSTGACANDPGAASAQEMMGMATGSLAVSCSKSSAGTYCMLDLIPVINAAQDNINALASNKTLLCSECVKKTIDTFLEIKNVPANMTEPFKMVQSLVAGANCPSSTGTSATGASTGSKSGAESATFSLLGALLFLFLL